MSVSWDPQKAKINRLKHGISFVDAEAVCYDPHALSRSDTDSIQEERFVATGCDSLGRILTIVYTYRDEMIRLISARKATKKERTEYETGI